jgi:hypothetical protein
MELSKKAMQIIKDGETKIRVMRSGMYQQLTFKIKRVKAGNEEFIELFSNRVIDTSEIIRIANDVGLPVEAQNGRVFPTSKAAKDFIGI